MGTLTPARPAGHGHRSRRCAGGIDFQSWQEGSGLQAINSWQGGQPANVSINALLSTTQRLSFQWDRGWMPMGLLPGTSGTRGDTQLRPCLSPCADNSLAGEGEQGQDRPGERLQSSEQGQVLKGFLGVSNEKIQLGSPCCPPAGAGARAHLGGTCGGRRAGGSRGAGRAGGAHPAASARPRSALLAAPARCRSPAGTARPGGPRCPPPWAGSSAQSGAWTS